MLHRQYEEIGAKHPVPRWAGAALGWGARAGRGMPGVIARRSSWRSNLLPVALRPRRFMQGTSGGMWWLFVAIAAHAAGYLGAEERKRVLGLLERKRQAGGREEASVLDELSRWRWAEHDVDGAIDLAKQAIAADPTWPYGYLTAAFYGSRSGRLDPLPLLIDAVRADPVCRPHIESQFADRPELLAAFRCAVSPS